MNSTPTDNFRPRPAPGDPAPIFTQRSAGNPRYAFDTAGGRYIVMCFFGSAGHPQSQAAIQAMFDRPDIFNDDHACFFGISIDARDEEENRVANRIPGYRFIWDFDLGVSRLYGVVPNDPNPQPGSIQLSRYWLVLDPTMRVIANIPFQNDGRDIQQVTAVLDGLPPVDRFAGIELQAPILYLPRVFEPELCQQLIGLYEASGGEESGFMREVDGRTVAVTDASFKRRKDFNLEDSALKGTLQDRFIRRVVPEILKVHQFRVTRMERYIVSCYAAEDGGHFSAHRDNTTKGTAHRRFAVSVNLNDDFDGGEVSFPEYGSRGYKAPPGGAVVFSCSLLHKVSRVTRGRRFAFLPFLYDDAAARIREQNAGFVGDTGSGYRATVSVGATAG
ncbi:2OG-Fe(II) oxygenase [Acuticoccus kandeliae]|uniref:2OG-Fe(II) oxygenase n=1 Tax=Acuticoccus kandeliae TaxID=2073160 RepID=UPI000D3EB5FF|nr:2OG-Fe(II) oxygenase [Acuticoccus kandeliae]